jgi:hypothetical protein
MARLISWLKTAAARPYTKEDSLASFERRRYLIIRTRVICLPDHVLLVLEFDHDTYRTENLLTDDLHVRLDICEDGGFDEVTLLSVSVSTKVNSRAFLFARVDVSHDSLVLNVGYLRTLVNLGAEWVSNTDFGGLGREALEELVVDARLDKDTGASTACLAVVPAGEKGQRQCIGL